MFKITNEWLDKHRTKNGGWTREQVNVLGLSWPLRKNWKKGITGCSILQSDRIKFESAANITCKTKKVKNADSELIKLLTIKRVGVRPNKDHSCPDALDMIRCGIGANYTGEYYDEVYELVLQPIFDYIEKHKKL